jgi:glycosyltransferase involved in cell wall biosynthesis
MVARDRPDVILIGRESDVWQVPQMAKEHSLPCVLMMRGAILWILDGSFPRDLGQQLLAQARAADLVVACAEHMAEAVRKVGLQNVKTIPNGVDTRLFAPGPKPPGLMRDVGIRDDETVVLHVSALHPVKRPLDLVESAQLALREHARLVYVILGDSPWRPPVEEACKRLGLRDRVRFVGRVDPVNVPEYFRLADVVVMPSRSEGLARVYLETQASGRLLLASDIAAAREVIADGQTGLLFRMGDIEELAAKTVYAAGNPGLRAIIGRRARSWVESRHRLDSMISQYAATMAEVGHRSASGPNRLS